MSDKDQAYDLAKELFRKEIWSMAYHEKELRENQRKLKVYREMMYHAEIESISDDEALETYETADDDPDFESVKHIAFWMLGRRISDVNHHENALNEAVVKYAAVKILIARCGYEIDEEALRESVRQQMVKD